MAVDSSSSTIIPIIPYIQTYEWGKYGTSSLVGTLKQKNTNLHSYSNSNIHFKLDESKTYAELWMGNHSSGMNYIGLNDTSFNNTSLLDYISHPLPFLFKILSVNKALSIQAHPNKELAKKLYIEYPQYYKDNNHKPEMTIALTKFETMCGFRDVNSIINYINTYQELRDIIGESYVNSFINSVSTKDESLIKEQLKIIFTNIMNCTNVERYLIPLLDRLSKMPKSSNLAPNEIDIVELIPRLNTQYPNDIGCFAPFLLNCFVLLPGESVSLGPNLPHAYLSGDCVEAMACSDNVVRAGLTPKFCHVDVLCEMLTYQYGSPSINTGYIIDKYSKIYYCDGMDEFMVLATILPGNMKYKVPAVKNESIVICISGSAYLNNKNHIQEGSVFYISPGKESESLELNVGNDGIVLYRCFENKGESFNVQLNL